MGARGDERPRRSEFGGRHNESHPSNAPLSSLQLLCASLWHCSAAVAQKVQTLYHLLLDCEELQRPLLLAPTVRVTLVGSAEMQEEWTDVATTARDGARI